LIQEVTETKGTEVKGTKEIPTRSYRKTYAFSKYQSILYPVRGFAPQGYNLEYSPSLLGVVQINYFDNKIGINMNLEKYYVTQISDSPIPVNWENSIEIKINVPDLETQPEKNATFSPLPRVASDIKNYDNWQDYFISIFMPFLWFFAIFLIPILLFGFFF